MANDDKKAKKQFWKTRSGKLAIVAALVLIAFLVGFIPTWLSKRAVSAELSIAQKDIRKEGIARLLTAAIIETTRGEYESASKITSDFFTSLRSEYDKGDAGPFASSEREMLKALFDLRDSTITMLAQRDQASGRRLIDIYLRYQEAVGNSVKIEPATNPQPSPAN